jgi:uncharacterized repeat protein (TIGR01451 family)
MKNKVISWIAIFSLIFNQLYLPAAVWAQAIDEPTSTPTIEEINQPTETPVEATPTAPFQVDSGNADALANTTNDINNDAQIVVEPTGVGCTLEGGCLVIESNKEASVSGEAQSEAGTGNNELTGASGDATINSGDALAGANNQNTVNTTQILIGEGTTGADSIEPLSGVPVIIVENDNGVDMETNTGAEANSGENNASENQGTATVNSGDAVAYANVVNLLNTNIVGGKFKILMMNEMGGETDDINMNEWWKDILGDGTSEAGLGIVGEVDGNNFIYINNFNWANLSNQVSVIANSGYNIANLNGDGAYIYSGNATALANVINLINANLIGSKFFLGVINIDANSLGDLILPRQDYFDLAGQNNQNLIVNNSNIVMANVNSTATAETGNNQTSGFGGEIITGDAYAQSNSMFLTSLNQNSGNQMFLALNTLGNWTGKIYGWNGPDSIDDPSGQGTNYFWTGGGIGAYGVGGESGMWVNNYNEAYLNDQVMVSANTGYNQALANGGSSNIYTGRAMALANITNFINFNLSGNNWFYGLVNIIGNWNGNVIVPYPDMSISIASQQKEAKIGDRITYDIGFNNVGYETAENVNIKMNLPAGVKYISDNSGFAPSVAGGSIGWIIPKVTAKGGGGFRVEVEVTSEFAKNGLQAKAFRLVPIAFAAENEKELVAEVVIKSEKAESNTGNKRSFASTVVVIDQQQGVTLADNDGIDHRQPVVEITAKNNVNDFVYNGDTVTFEVGVKSLTDVSLNKSYLWHGIYDEKGNLYRENTVNIGEIKPYRNGNVRFGIAMNSANTPSGKYTTVDIIYGVAGDGIKIASNEATTAFLLKQKGVVITAAAAGEKSGGEVLGITDTSCNLKENLLPYLLLLLVSTLWLLRQTAKWTSEAKDYSETNENNKS